jgi:hypothetical protein
MSTPADRGAKPNSAPDTHWCRKSPDAAEPGYEQMISETQAVERALAKLGRDAPAAEVRRLLQQCGLDVPESVVEDVRALLPHGPTH